MTLAMNQAQCAAFYQKAAGHEQSLKSQFAKLATIQSDLANPQAFSGNSSQAAQTQLTQVGESLNKVGQAYWQLIDSFNAAVKKQFNVDEETTSSITQSAQWASSLNLTY
jgi:hypothetical protein